MGFSNTGFSNRLDVERAVPEEEGQCATGKFSDQDGIFRPNGQSFRRQDLVPLGSEGNREIVLDCSMFVPTEDIRQISQLTLGQVPMEIILLPGNHRELSIESRNEMFFQELVSVLNGRDSFDPHGFD